MIRLRRMLERGRKHPVLGPIVLVLLVLLLAMVCFHAAQDGWDGAAEIGALCIGLVTMLAAVVSERARSRTPLLVVTQSLARGPPRAFHAVFIGSLRQARLDLALPLRR